MEAKCVEDHDPLFAGFYRIADATRLLGVSNAAKLRGWLNGWPASGAGPIVLRDFQDGATVSFLDLMELRFVDHFRRQGVPLQTLRKAAERARKDWHTSHPFALDKVKYLTDRRNIFAQIAEDANDTVTLNLATGQHEIWEALESVVSRGITFDATSHLASHWIPRPEYPGVVVDPRLAFGKPSVAGRGVPTKVLYRQFRAGATKGMVAKWFGVSEDDVDQAVNFEISIAA